MARIKTPRGKTELQQRKWAVTDGKKVFMSEVPYDRASKFVEFHQDDFSGLTIVTDEASKRISRLAKFRKQTQV